MKIAALILGILGGLAGLIGSIFALFIGGIEAFSLGGSSIIAFGWVALFLSLLGIVAGAISMGKTKIAGILMLIAGVGGFICISLAYVVAGPLLIIGGILALIGSRKS